MQERKKKLDELTQQRIASIEAELAAEEKRLNATIEGINEEIAARRRLRQEESDEDAVARAQKKLDAAKAQLSFARDDYSRAELQKEVTRAQQSLDEAVQSKEDNDWYAAKQAEIDALERQIALAREAAQRDMDSAGQWAKKALAEQEAYQYYYQREQEAAQAAQRTAQVASTAAKVATATLGAISNVTNNNAVKIVTGAAVSCTLTQNLDAPGDFEFAIPCDARYADQLAIGRLVRIDKDFWGIVDGLRFDATQQGQLLTVSGRDLKGIVANRITIPPQAAAVQGAQGYDAQSGATETILKHYVDANLVTTPLQPARSVAGLTIAPDLRRGVADDRYITRHDPLDAVLEELCRAAGLGYDIVPDLEAGEYVFDVVQGIDRSGEQSERPRIVFDPARKSAVSQTYTHTGRDARNVFYATLSGAAFADEALTMTYVRDGEDEAAGLARREQHLSISADTPTAGGEYDELRRYALIEAERYRPARSFACDILDGRARYGVDYFLGDMVSVKNADWGVCMTARLVSMTTSYTEQGVGRTATFGTPALNVFGRLRRQIRQGGLR